MIIVAFGVGMFVGNRNIFKILYKYDFLMLSTVILLFVMGYEIGNNDKLFKSLPSIGLISLELSVAAVIGSLIVASIYYFMDRKR